jgi:putative transposase
VIVVQLRYAFRLYPDAGQRIALAKAFGCARVVFNDCVRAREDARRAQQPFPKAGELSTRLITEAKKTVERSWLEEVSAVVLQQSLRDVETAYRNFFASLKGTRKGPRIGPPRFKSRKDARQSIRFTANARWHLTDSGRLNLPKIGAVKVKWSRRLRRGPVRRHEDRLPQVPAPRGEEAEEGPARAVPQAEGIQEPGQCPPEGCPRPRQGHRRPP